MANCTENCGPTGQHRQGDPGQLQGALHGPAAGAAQRAERFTRSMNGIRPANARGCARMSVAATCYPVAL